MMFIARVSFVIEKIRSCNLHSTLSDYIGIGAATITAVV